MACPCWLFAFLAVVFAWQVVVAIVVVVVIVVVAVIVVVGVFGCSSSI